MPTSARLVAVAAHGLAGSRTDLPSAPLSEVEWFDLVHGCTAADLVGLLATAVHEGHLPVTAGQAEELDVLAAEHAGLSALVERHAVTMSSLLAIAGIDHRIVDGPGLALAYPTAGSHPVRPVRSVRVLVAPGRLADARSLQGARPSLPDGPVARHERLTIVDELPGVGAGPGADLPALLGAPARIDLDDRSVPVLTVEQQLVVACAAQATTPVPALVGLRDVAQLALVPALDARAARRLADRVGMSEELATGVAQAWTWFDLADKTQLSVWALRRAARPDARASGGTPRVGLAQRVLGRRPAVPAAAVPPARPVGADMTAAAAAAVPAPAVASPMTSPSWSPDPGAPAPDTTGRHRRSTRRPR
jgi:hypothetical protein